MDVNYLPVESVREAVRDEDLIVYFPCRSQKCNGHEVHVGNGLSVIREYLEENGKKLNPCPKCGRKTEIRPEDIDEIKELVRGQ